MNRSLTEQYAAIRAAEARALSERTAEARQKAPRLIAIAAERAALFGADCVLLPEARLAALERLAAEEAEALAAAGLPADALKLRYRCAACRDTGFTGEIVKKPCACRLRMAVRLDPLARINAEETFEAFSLAVFADEQQRKRMANARLLTEQYADALPFPPRPNLLILGKTGLGKTYLGNAVAYRAVCRGVDASRVTAYMLVQDVLSDIRAGTRHAAHYARVPLLVLDDLGSEPVIPNVSEEWLFTIINERVLGKRATVVITNLSLRELKERYGDRLTSRISDKNTTQALLLTGSSLRWQA